jgi:Zn-dependent alcohol dehydrogenase
MLTKSRVIESLQSMPERITMDEIVERLQSLDDLETALDDIRKGNGLKHEDVMAEARQWLKEK